MRTPFPSRWLIDLVKLNPAKWDLGRSIRFALATAIPLIIGMTTNTLSIFLWISLGGLICCAGEKGLTYSYRLKLIPISSFIGVLGFLGGFFSSDTLTAIIGSILFIGFFSFAMGIISSWEQVFSIGAMQGLLLASICIGIPHLESHNYFILIGLYLIGALFAWLMLAVEYLLVRDKPQRIIISNMLSSLAQLATQENNREKAREKAYDAQSLAYSTLIQGRHKSTSTTNEFNNYALILQSVGLLTAMIVGNQFDASTQKKIADWLNHLASAIEQRKPLPVAIPTFNKNSQLDLQVSTLEKALLGKPTSAPIHLKPSPNKYLTFNKGVLLNAFRLSLCMSIAVIAFHFIPGNHSFWIPLTVALIMTPDFGALVTRSIQRSIGTFLGVLIGAILLFLLPKGFLFILAIILLSFLLPYSSQKNYVIQSVCMTPLILLFVELISNGPITMDYLGQRALATLIGALIVIIFGYLIWPKSIFSQVQPSFLKSIQTVSQYLQAIFNHSLHAIRKFRRLSYFRLSDLRIALQHSLEQPPPIQRESLAWYPAVKAAERLCDTLTIYINSQYRETPSPAVITSWINCLDQIAKGEILDKDRITYKESDHLLLQIEGNITYLSQLVNHI